jgi:hypothetical protein
MKKLSTILAAALLATAISATAQMSNQNTQDSTGSTVAPTSSAVNGGGVDPVADRIPATPAAANDTPASNREQRGAFGDDARRVPDYSKSPYSEPKDWSYIESENGGG